MIRFRHLGLMGFLLGWCLAGPAPVFPHSEEKHIHDMENLPAKPEGMIEFKGGEPPAAPGQEYMPDAAPPMDHGGHDMHMEGGTSGDPFRTRGAHGEVGADFGKSRLNPSKALLARGKAIYLHMCVFCHGKDGNGGGAAMEFLYPWPRDFRKGIFKFRSTPTGKLPRDADLYRTIIRGIPGTSMPAWAAALSPEDTWALVNLVKSFSPRFQQESPGNPVPIGAPPKTTAASVARGKELYIKHRCQQCHGAAGKGDGKLSESLMDAWKHAVFVHDITNPNFFKAGYGPRDIFRTLSTGLDGTPMESFAHLPAQDRWDLVAFIRSNFTEAGLHAKFETDVFSFPVNVVLDTNVNSPVWNGVKSTDLVLRPLSARRGAVESINFTSVNNGEQLAIRLRWRDPTPDQSQARSDVYRDQVAVQFALGDVTLHSHGHNEPFWGMGNRGKPVNIWHWQAGLEEALESAKNDTEYVTGGVDMDALLFGGNSSNPVAMLNPVKQSAVTELNAEGFGTITPQPKDNQNVVGKGEWADGVWTVVFLRDMVSVGRWDVNLLDRKGPAVLALAVWDGLQEDRNGRKVVSVWQRLHILQEPPAAPAAK